ncbi:MAG: tetratricopeptide repeat protein [Polyangiaceae bacterium]|nr:tetratricopeptide repeat protein [Polyangiaceae bacterium]
MKPSAALALAFVIAVGRVAHAAPPVAKGDPDAARALFYEARSLMQAGRYAEACPKLEESLRIDDGIGTRYNLADCNEHIGKLASAWKGFSDVASLAIAAHQPEREQVARKRAHDLEPRLPKLVIDVESLAAEMVVQCDGETVEASAVGKPIAVDPGLRKVTVSAPGKQTWERTIEAVEGRTVMVTVPSDLPDLAISAMLPALPSPTPTARQSHVPPASPAPSALGALPARAALPSQVPTATATVTSAESLVSLPAADTERATPPARVVGYVALGLGAVGLGFGAVYGLRSVSKRDDAKDHCVADRCDADGVALRKQALDAGNISTVATIGGAVAFASGLVLVLIAPSETKQLPITPGQDGSTHEKKKQPLMGSLRAAATVGPGSGGVVLKGNWP